MKRVKRIAIVAAIVAAVVIGALWTLAVIVLQVAKMPSASMMPTVAPGEHVLAWPVAGAVEPGDVVLFKSPPWVPRYAGALWIKRVVAVGGQRIRRGDDGVYVVDDKVLTCDGARVVRWEDVAPGADAPSEHVSVACDEHVGDRVYTVMRDAPSPQGAWPAAGEPMPSQQGLQCDDTACLVEPGFVFVAGDNRDHSADSAIWGGVPVENVSARVFAVWMTAWRLVH